MVIDKNSYQRYERRVIEQLLGKRNNTRNIQRRDTGFIMRKMLIGQFLEFIQIMISFCFFN